MKPRNATYTVVENAGYEGERDVLKGHKSATSAQAWIDRMYAADEIESLHVLIRRDCGDGRTYEF